MSTCFVVFVDLLCFITSFQMHSSFEHLQVTLKCLMTELFTLTQYPLT